MEIIRVTLAAILSVAALFVITKIMGHKQVAQLDFFDYVSGITIGSIGAELATELEAPERPLIALAVYGAVSLILSVASQKIPRTRKYINGTPTILMDNGKIFRDNLKKAKIDLSELMLLCREQGFFDLEEIQTAVFEHNGRLSILPKSENRPATPKDLKVGVSTAEIGIELIMDGRIMGENLLRVGKGERWLRSRLSEEKIRDERAVLLAVYKPKGDKMTVYPME